MKQTKRIRFFYFLLFIQLLSCEPKKNMQKSAKSVNLPHFFIYNPEIAKDNSELAKLIIEGIEANPPSEPIIGNLKEELKKSKEVVLKQDEYYIMFGSRSKSRYLKDVNKDADEMLRIIEMVQNGEATKHELTLLKLAVLKKYILYGELEHSWFLDLAFFEFDLNVFTSPAKALLKQPYELGSFHSFEIDFVNRIINYGLIEEPLIAVSDENVEFLRNNILFNEDEPSEFNIWLANKLKTLNERNLKLLIYQF